MTLAKKVVAGSLLALAGIGCAQATVVYDWVPLTSSENIGSDVGPINIQLDVGQIVITDQAYQSGSLSIDYGPSSDAEGTIGEDGAIVDSPVISAFMANNNEPYGAFVEPTSDGFAFDGQSITADLSFLSNGRLSGSLDIFDYSDNFDSSGSGNLWSIFNLNSDYFTGAGRCAGEEPNGCDAGTGYWQLADSTADVPAPSAWSLFGLSILGVFGLAWRRSRV